jgi:hypothetical protein
MEITQDIDIISEIETIDTVGQRRDSPGSIAKPVRPIELTLWVAFPFVSLFIVLAILLGVLFAKAEFDGTSAFIDPDC